MVSHRQAADVMRCDSYKSHFLFFQVPLLTDVKLKKHDSTENRPGGEMMIP